MGIINLKTATSLLAPLLNKTGIPSLFGKHAGIGHILMFHRVIPETNAERVHNHLSLEITPEQLENTINFFKERAYDFIKLDQLSTYLQPSNKRKFVIFTFDDGYLDNLEYAYPIFKRHHVPFTIYITTNFINGTAMMWWYLIEKMVLENEEVLLNWKGTKHQLNCRTTSSKEASFNKIRRLIIHETSPEQYHKELSELFKPYIADPLKFTKSHSLSWDQVRQLALDPLVTIGAHTKNHKPLIHLDEQTLADEILGGKLEIEKEIQKQVVHFSYPFGKTVEAHEREYRFVANGPFESAVTTNIQNLTSTDSSKMYSLPRININKQTTQHVLQLHISGIISYLNQTKAILFG